MHMNIFYFCYSVTYVVSNYITAAIVNELVGERNPKKLLALICCYSLEIVFRIVRDKSYRKFRSFHIISEKWQEALLNEKNFSMDYKYMENDKIKTMRQTLTDKSTGGVGFDGMVFQLFMLCRSFWVTVLCLAVLAEMLFMYSDKALVGFGRIIDSPATSLLFFAVVAVLIILNYKVNGKYSRKIADNKKECAFSGRLLHYYLNDYLDDSKSGEDIRIFSQKKLIDYSSDLFYGE